MAAAAAAPTEQEDPKQEGVDANHDAHEQGLMDNVQFDGDGSDDEFFDALEDDDDFDDTFLF